MKKQRHNILVGLLVLFALFVGYLFGHQNLQYSLSQGIAVKNADLGKPPALDFGPFWDVFNRVQAEYFGKINSQKWVEGAIRGALASLEDPYSTYLNTEESKLLNADLSGQLEGVGVEIALKNNRPTVMSALPDSPAEKAGIKTLDQVTKIDDKDTAGMSLADVVNAIRGKPNTKISLTIYREKTSETKTYEIIRQKIQVDDITYQKMDGGVAYIRVRQFGDKLDESVDRVAAKFAEDQGKKIILDLRDNPGGILDQAVSLTGAFLEPGKIVVQEKNKEGKTSVYQASQVNPFKNVSVVVLINSGSASASEITAGALRDHGRAVLVGEKTYGKGTVQALENLAGGGSLKITVAEWLTPNGEGFDKKGIAPDIEVGLSDEDFNNNRDPQLDRAVEQINKT